MLTSSSAWRSFFSCSSCSSTPPKRYLPDDGPELVWTNPADNVLKKGRAAASSSYKTLPTSSSPPPPTTTTTSTTTPFTFQEVPLQRTMQSMDTHTTVTMNAISFDSQDWEDDDDEDDIYDIYGEDDVVTHRVPELSLSKPMIPIDDDSSRCMMIGPIGCSYPYASTALIQGYDDDDDEDDDDEEEPIVVAQHNNISQLASRIGQSMERTFSQDGGQRRMLPRAWSW